MLIQKNNTEIELMLIQKNNTEIVLTNYGNSPNSR